MRQTLLSIGYRLEFSSGKTDNAERVIDLDDRTITVLRAHRKAQATERLLIGELYDDHELVFAHPDGRPVHPDVFSQTFERHVKASTLPRIRLHDLRHTHARPVDRRGDTGEGRERAAQVHFLTPAFTRPSIQHVMPGDAVRGSVLGALVFGQ